MSKIRVVTYLLLLVIAFFAFQRHGFLEAPLEPQVIGWSSDLAYWPGHSEEWIEKAIPQAVLRRECLIAPSTQALDYRVEARLKQESPWHQGELRQLEFVEPRPGWLSRHYRVYLFKREGIWTILDAECWEIQMEG